jgi:uncharacterized damage-inducible protein DinB
MAEQPMETTLRTALWQQCGATITELSDEKAHQQVDFPWTWRKPMSYLELLLYTMRHVQEHAAQLSLFLGRHGIPDEVIGWVGRAKEEAGL